MLPTFILGGAAKAGTTTLWELLRAHPQVYMPPVKEVNYFVEDVWYSRRHKGWDWYQELFPPQPGIKAYGEASVNYLNRPEAAGLIREQLPGVHLLFCLRNPADRLYSHYNFDVQEGRRLPDFGTLIKDRGDYWDEIAWGSRYDLHLERFLAFFPRQQIHIFLFDDLITKPQELLPDIYASIGVNASFRPGDLNEQANASRRPKRAWLQKAIIAVEKATYNLDIPPALRRPLSAIRRNLRNSNLEAQRLPRLDQATRESLIKEFLPSTEYVETFLGRSLPSWH